MDLILTNMSRSFQGTCPIETGLPDFHLMTLTVMRKNLKKIKPIGHIIIFQMNITENVCLIS